MFPRHRHSLHPEVTLSQLGNSHFLALPNSFTTYVYIPEQCNSVLSVFKFYENGNIYSFTHCFFHFALFVRLLRVVACVGLFLHSAASGVVARRIGCGQQSCCDREQGSLPTRLFLKGADLEVELLGHRLFL